jgi:hypothetical protein
MTRGTLIARENVVDGIARVVARELEERVATGRHDPEVARPAALRLLHHEGRTSEAVASAAARRIVRVRTLQNVIVTLI